MAQSNGAPHGRTVVRIKLGGKPLQLTTAGGVLAKRRLQQLGYPPPNASVEALGAALCLDMPGVSEFNLFPPWDKLMGPPARGRSFVPASEHGLAPSRKRRRVQSDVPAGGVGADGYGVQGAGGSSLGLTVVENVQGCCSPAAVGATPAPPSPQEKDVVHRAAQEPGHADGAPKSAVVAATGRAAGAGPGQLSSASDQATTCALSPTEVTAAVAGQAQQGQVPQRDDGSGPGPGSIRTLGGPMQPPAPLQPSLPQQAQTEGRGVAGRTRRVVSIGVQTSQPCSLLSGSFLPLPGHASMGLKQAWWPAQQAAAQHLPPHLQLGPGREGRTQVLLDTALGLKRSADRQRGSGPWTAASIAQYLEAALAYMAAVECMLQASHTPEAVSQACNMCTQTADFLLFSARALDTFPATASLARDCLRCLAERLAAVCMLREAGLGAARLRDYADRADRLLLAAQAGLGGGGAMAGAVPSDMAALQAKLVAGARRMTRALDLMRRSVLSLQALADRDDVRDSAHAAAACTHMSAFCMDGGQVDGARVVAHAHSALQAMQRLWGPSRVAT